VIAISGASRLGLKELLERVWKELHPAKGAGVQKWKKVVSATEAS
jgi:hypothetical protein